MAYLGNTPTTQSFSPAIDYFSGNGSTVAFTLSRPVASVAQVQVTIENVPQNPGTAFTVSGNTITFDGAPPSGTNNIYVYYTSPITQVIQPGQGTVGTAQIVDNAITTAKIAAGAVIPADLSTGAPVWDSSGNVGIGTSSPVQKLDVSTTTGNIAISVRSSFTNASASVYYGASRGWFVGADVGGGDGRFAWYDNTAGAERMRIDSAGRVTTPSQPAFSVYKATNQTLTFGANTKINLDTVEFNDGSHFNTSTGRFTAPIAGRYLFTAAVQFQANNGSPHSNFWVNGADSGNGWLDFGSGSASSQSRIYKLNAGDYVELYSYTSASSIVADGPRCKMTGFLIG